MAGEGKCDFMKAEGKSQLDYWKFCGSWNHLWMLVYANME